MKRSMFILLAGLICLMGSPAFATAPYWVQNNPASATTSVPSNAFVQREITAREARAIALARVPGEVVDISRNGDSFRVRIIASDGRVVDIVVDAKTGRVR